MNVRMPHSFESYLSGDSESKRCYQILQYKEKKAFVSFSSDSPVCVLTANKRACIDRGFINAVFVLPHSWYPYHIP